MIILYTIQACNLKEQDIIIDELVKYNLTQVPATQDELFVDLSKKIVDQQGDIIAGIVARMYCWNCVYVDTLWVSEAHRKNGFGKDLLEVVEQEAKDKGATLIHLDTFDFQAKEFYQKLWYEIYGELKNCPEGHSRYYLKKELCRRQL